MNYTKKSLSLFLAVLMVLSCWVWVAPANVSAEEIIIEEGTDAPVEGEETKTPCADDEHNFVVSEDAEKTWEATCTKEGQTTEICSVCETEKVTPIPVTEHNYVLQENGNMKCECSALKTVKITFEDTSKMESETIDAVIGNAYTYEADGDKETEAYTYKFIGWFKGSTKITESTKLEIVVADEEETYTAQYLATEKKFTITYKDDNGEVLASYIYNYDDIIIHTAPELSYKQDEPDRYKSHPSWKVDGIEPENGRAKGSVTYTLVYGEKDHDFVEMQFDASCTTPGGYRYVCACGCSYIIDDSLVVPQLPHTVEYVISVVPATIYETGLRTVYCSTCKNAVTEEIPVLEATKIALQVYNDKGEPARYATIKLSYTVYEKDKAKEIEYKDSFPYVTDGNGYLEIKVPVDFKGWVVRVLYNGGSHYSNEIVTGDEVNVIGLKAEEPEEEEEPADEKEAHTKNCSCSCHKRGPVGFFYRFYKYFMEKFSKSEIKCCTSPEKKIFLSFFSF